MVRTRAAHFALPSSLNRSAAISLELRRDQGTLSWPSDRQRQPSFDAGRIVPRQGITERVLRFLISQAALYILAAREAREGVEHRLAMAEKAAEICKEVRP